MTLRSLSFQTTIYDDQTNQEFEVEVEFDYTPAFNGGWREPSEPAAVDIIAVTTTDGHTAFDYAELPANIQARLEQEAFDKAHDQ